MIARIVNIADIRLMRYLLASIGALAIDMGSFLALLAAGVWPAPASAIGYCLGIVAHWLLSSRAVFADTVAANGFARTRQKGLFVISALIGLALTIFIVWVGESAGIDPRIAKLVSIGVSFSATWLLRSRVVFRTDCALARPDA